MALVDSKQVVEKKLKFVQRHATAKLACKKFIGTMALKSKVITLGDVRAFF